MAALTKIREAMEGDDVTVIASTLLRSRTAVSVEFVPEQGRINLVRACDPDRVFGTFPVRPGVRAMLAAELRSPVDSFSDP